jgi:hypothetical protein
MVPAMRALVSFLTLFASTLTVLGTSRPALAQDEPAEAEASEAPAGGEEAEASDSEKAEEADEKPAAKPKAEDSKAPDDDDYGHFMQFGLRAGLVGGIRMVFRYDPSPRCKDPADDPDEPMKFCGFKEPLGIDLALSFAPLDALEPFI